MTSKCSRGLLASMHYLPCDRCNRIINLTISKDTMPVDHLGYGPPLTLFLFLTQHLLFIHKCVDVDLG